MGNKLATKSTESATESTVMATVDFLADLLPVLIFVDCHRDIWLCRQCVPGFTGNLVRPFLSFMSYGLKLKLAVWDTVELNHSAHNLTYN